MADDVVATDQARIKLTGFNIRTTPELEGMVKAVSPDVIIDESTGIPHYRVKIGVSAEELNKLKVGQLVPGMPVEVFIETGEKTAMAYLTDPFVENFDRAFRE